MTLVALLGATFVGTLNNSVANVAVPDISEDFDVSVGTGVWFVSSFVLAVAVLMPLAGRLGDLLGAKRVFLAGLALFMISSLVVAVARTFPVAVLGRTMQGASGSTVLPCIMVTIARLFGPTQRGRAVGLWAAVNAAALAAGPALGGAVVQLWGWRAIFWLDLPASLIVMLAAWVLVPADGPTSRGKLDLFGASLFTTALVAVTVAFGRGADWGWTNRLTIGLLAIAPVAAAWFVYVERRATYPFIDLGLFRRGAYPRSRALPACRWWPCSPSPWPFRCTSSRVVTWAPASPGSRLPRSRPRCSRARRWPDCSPTAWPRVGSWAPGRCW